ncbi:MAG: WbqC family protein [Flavobacteriales bacterium]|nr:WbqC family protein [Flavobacteriales bacterium]
MTPLLSAFYFGSVEHYRLLAQHPRVVVDIGEHYERQSYRTRTSILGPNGQQDLQVPITRISGTKMPMRSVGLSYAETWPRQHLHAIRSAYGQTPWFIHYVDEIEAIVLKKYERLVELDLATMRLGMKWLGLTTEVIVSEEYVAGSALAVVGPTTVATDNRPPTTDTYADLRSTFHPKKPLPPTIAEVPPYPQVFPDRFGFVGRLSIVDLLCNCGPEARSILAMKKV